MKRAAQFVLVMLIAVAAIGSVGSRPVAAAAAQVQQADPAIGPHTRDEARHQHDVLKFAPASGTTMPLRQRAAAAATGPNALIASHGDLSKEVLGFAPYWALNSNQQTIWKYNLLSTLAYFALAVNGDGSFNTTDAGYSGWQSQNLVDMINRAHGAGDRVVVVIKQGNDATVNQIVTTEASRQAAITNTINAIASKQLDGVNVDFEGSASGYPNVQAGMTTFMTELSSAVHGRWPSAFVSIDTYGGSASGDSGIFKIGDLAPVTDAFFIMAYDSSFSNTPGHAGPTAPLNGWTYNDTSEVAQYLAKAPASKVILGVPYYGYKWSVANTDPYGAATAGAIADTYAGVLDDFSCGALQQQRNWDTVAASPWATWWSPASGDPCGGNKNSWRELYYDDAQSLGYKYDLVNSSNLRGTGMWALGYDGTSTDLWNELSLKFASPWAPLGGIITAGPGASSSGTNRIAAFARGQDNQLWHRWFDGTTWNAWEPLGGILTANPAAVSMASNRIDVFGRGQDNQLWHRMFDGTNWTAWEPLGGLMSSGPAVASWSADRLDVFIQGKDNQLWQKTLSAGVWSAWQPLGGIITATPGVASMGPNRLDVFARGGDNQLWHKWYDGTAWNGWEPLGGVLGSGPAVASWGMNRLDVFIQGRDNQLWHRGWDLQGWSGWQGLSGILSDSPAATAPAVGRIDVFGEGGDRGLWHKAIFFY